MNIGNIGNIFDSDFNLAEAAQNAMRYKVGPVAEELVADQAKPEKERRFKFERTKRDEMLSLPGKLIDTQTGKPATEDYQKSFYATGLAQKQGASMRLEGEKGRRSPEAMARAFDELPGGSFEEKYAALDKAQGAAYDLMRKKKKAKKKKEIGQIGQLADLALGGSGVIAAAAAGLAGGDIEDALKAGVKAYGIEKLGSLGAEKLGLKGIEKDILGSEGKLGDVARTIKGLEDKGKMAEKSFKDYFGFGGDDSVTVKSGDTLSAIAERAGVTLDELKAANPNITDINKIDVGQTINIPGQGGFLSGIADFLTPDKTAGQSTLGLFEDFIKGELSESSPVRPDSFLSGVGQTIQGITGATGATGTEATGAGAAGAAAGGMGGLGGLLAGGAGLLALKELLGEKADVTTIGGGFDPTISPVMEQIVSEAQKSYLEGPRQYDPTERFAFFTPEEQLARQRTAMLAQPGMDPYQAHQAGLLGLAGGALGDYQRRLGQQYAPLGTAAEQYKEAADVARGAARGLDVADLDIQKFMDPYQQAVTDIAKREAREESAKRQRDIGAAAAKAGAFGGSRMALLEAEEASGLGERLADIQARGSAEAYRQALGAAERERELGLGVAERGLGREAGLAQQLAGLGGASVGLSGAYGAAAQPYGQIPSQLTGLASQYGALGGDIFGREQAKVGMLADVGREGRGLEQQRRDFAYQQFQQADPFARLGLFGQAITPALGMVRATEYLPQETKIQQLAGLAPIVSGLFNRAGGGKVGHYQQGGGLSSLAPLLSPVKEKIKEGASGFIDFLLQSQADSPSKPVERIEQLKRAKQFIEGEESAGQQRKRVKDFMKAEEERMKRLQPQIEKGMAAKEAAAKEQAAEQQIVPQQATRQPAKPAGLGDYLKSLDPFTGLGPMERIRLGLGILGQRPELGQSALGTIAAGASGALEQLREEEIDELGEKTSLGLGDIFEGVKAPTITDFETRAKNVGGLQNVKTSKQAAIMGDLRLKAEEQYTKEVLAGIRRVNPLTSREEILEIYANLIRNYKPESVEDEDADAGASQAKVEKARDIVSDAGKIE